MILVVSRSLAAHLRRAATFFTSQVSYSQRSSVQCNSAIQPKDGQGLMWTLFDDFYRKSDGTTQHQYLIKTKRSECGFWFDCRNTLAVCTTRPWTERANMFFGFHGGMSVLAVGEPKSRSAVSEEDGYGYAVSTVSCVMFVAGASRSKVHDHTICLRAPLDCAVFSMQHQPGKNQNLEPFQPRCCPAPQYLCWCQSFDPHSAITCWCTARETHTQAHNMLFWFETLGCFGMRHASYLGLIGFLVMACLADTALHVWVSQELCSLCSRNWVIETITEQTQPVRPSFKAGSNCFCSCRVLKHCARMITYVLPRW